MKDYVVSFTDCGMLSDARMPMKKVSSETIGNAIFKAIKDISKENEIDIDFDFLLEVNDITREDMVGEIASGYDYFVGVIEL